MDTKAAENAIELACKNWSIVLYPINQEIQISRSNNAVAPHLQYSAVLAPQ